MNKGVGEAARPGGRSRAYWQGGGAQSQRVRGPIKGTRSAGPMGGQGGMVH